MGFYKEYILNSGEKLVVRNANISDAYNFTNFTNKLFKETSNFVRGKEDDDVTVEMQTNYIDKHLQSKNGLLLLAEINNQIVGHAHLEEKSSKFKLKHRSEFGIGILKDYWGIGIAQILMQEIIDFAYTTNFEQIELVVINSNERAKSLYRKFGFVEFGIFKNSFKYANGTYDDGIYMIKTLKD